MLTAVKIEKFLSCKDVTLSELGPVVALVGRNGAGKTNILKAIEWAANAATSTEDLSALISFVAESGTLISVTLEFKIDNQFFRYSVRIPITPKGMVNGTDGDEYAVLNVSFSESLSKRRNESAEWIPLIARQDEIVDIRSDAKQVPIGKLSPCLPAIMKLLPTSQAAKFIPIVLPFLSAIRYYPLEEASELPQKTIISPVEYAQWLIQFDNGNEPLDSLSNRILHMHLERKEELERVKRLLGSSGIGLIEDIEVKELTVTAPNTQPTKLYQILFKLGDVPNSSLYLWQLSLGTRRVLRILTTMIFDKSSVFLFEQPEDAIHAGLLRKLIDIIRTEADPSQFILASHSNIVKDSLHPEDVRLVEMKDGATHVRPLTPLEISVAKEFVGNVGPLSDYLESVVEE
ncbi:MAG TPA: AAA family ATPase [Planctomycetota bacterium]|nr:AAA family ATPase [Planctomycetota bacterium]